MKKIDVDLENCFGISKLKHSFDFSKTNIILIYAPNGMMKTSFAKTFDCIANEVAPGDRVYREKQSKYEVLADGETISPKNIYVANAEFDINSNESITTFLASKELKEEYDDIYKYLDSLKGDFIKKLKKVSNSTDCEKEFMNAFSDYDNNFFSILLKLKKEISENHVLYKFSYNDIFDKKGNVEKFLDKNKSLIQEYFNNYKTLLQQSDFFQTDKGGKSFGTYQANSLQESISDDGFFYAKHKLILNNNTTISSAEQFKQVITCEVNKIFLDEKLKKIFEKIDKALASNEEVRRFKVALENDNSIIPLLTDYNEFKKEVWLGYLHELEKDSTELINIYQTKASTLDKLIQNAKTEKQQWIDTIKIFNARFHAPFTIEITNQEDVVLKQSTANLAFKYDNQKDKPRTQDKKDLIEILSRGERRAFYILQLLFELEARKVKKEDNLIILDDIADSFDYKNKYAILEYLADLNKMRNFKLIVLTHNFDFYRTLFSRVHLNRACAIYMTIKSENEEILLKNGQYVNDPFEHFIQNAKKEKCFISLIPFLRNILKYTLGNESCDYLLLTSCLHMKNDTKEISIKKIELLFKKYIHECASLSSCFNKSKVFDLIKKTADKINNEKNVDEISLENKLVLSIAIRLIAEDFVINKLKIKQERLEEIKRKQTRVLIEMYKSLYPNDKTSISVLEQVNLMTPENIHLNSFMYEPLIDMSSIHLIRLYKEVKQLRE